MYCAEIVSGLMLSVLNSFQNKLGGSRKLGGSMDEGSKSNLAIKTEPNDVSWRFVMVSRFIFIRFS